jgi:hypothetical protein
MDLGSLIMTRLVVGALFFLEYGKNGLGPLFFQNGETETVVCLNRSIYCPGK